MYLLRTLTDAVAERRSPGVKSTETYSPGGRAEFYRYILRPLSVQSVDRGETPTATTSSTSAWLVRRRARRVAVMELQRSAVH